MADPGALPPPLDQRYQVLDELGRGAMGAVLRCHDRKLDRQVALKRMLRAADPELRARFHREAACLAGLSHPNIVKVLDHGDTEDGPFLVMELLDGTPLGEGSTPADPVDLMRQVAAALDAVHEAGLVHRDLKPANVLQTHDGRAVLVDFGLLHVRDRTVLTRTGEVLGTPAFLAPETFTGGEVTAAADWYAWGVTLFFLLEQRLPYTSREVFDWITQGRGPSMRFAVLDPSDPRAQLIVRCLSPDPSRRPANLAAIDALLAQAPAPRSVGAQTEARPALRALTPEPPPGEDSGARPGLSSGARLAVGASDRLDARDPGRGRAGLAVAAVGVAGVVGLLLGAPGPSGPTPTTPPEAPTRPPLAERLARLDLRLRGRNPQGRVRLRATRAGPTLVLIPAGGYPSRLSSDIQRPAPAREVRLPAFLIGEYEVRVRDFERYLAATGRRPPVRWNEQKRRPDFPVVLVPYGLARDYCEWAGGRLPTVFEYERAAAGAEGRSYPWGDEPPTKAHANFAKDNLKAIFGGIGPIERVGSYPKGVSADGVHDLAGNVAEWSGGDWDPPFPPARPPDEQPIQGGNWFSDAANLQAWVARSWGKKEAEGNLGMRLVLDLDPDLAAELEATP